MVPAIQCQGFALTEAIKEAVNERCEKLFRRTHGLSLSVNLEKETEARYRVHLEYTTAHDGVFNATSQGGDLYGLIHESSDKVLRQLNDALGRQEARYRGSRIGDHLEDSATEK